MRFPLLLLGAAALSALAPLVPGQDDPCPPGTTVPCSYRVSPIPNTYASILGAGGTVVLGFAAGADDVSMPVPLGGFPFNFFCAPQGGPLAVCTNGFANFGAASAAFTNHHPGDVAAPNNAILPWHDDLILTNVAPPSTVAYNFGFYGAGSLVVQWTNMATWTAGGAGAGSISFQAVLWSTPTAGLGDVIDFHYDRSTAPPVMAPCLVAGGGPSTFATSATVGLESGAAALATVGVEATDRGAANSVFPPCDLRLTPVSFSGTEQNYLFTSSIVPQEPFCHIEGLIGTLAVGPSCAATPCYDDDSAAHSDGVQIALPWKFNLAGRVMKHASMDSNGYLQLGGGNFTSVFANAAILSAVHPNSILAAFWDDLEGSPIGPIAAGMFYRVDGPPGCRVMTFEWHEMGAFVGASGDCTGAGNISFQVKLYEGSAGSLAASAPPCPYDVVVPGMGNDRVEFHYDHAAFVPGPFTATIGIENHKGSLGVASLGGAANAGPPFTGAGLPAKVVVDQCDFGVVRFYGDPGSTCPFVCLPEIKSNAVPPRIGNPFALEMVGASPGFPLLNLFFGPPIPGIRTPVPCGGIPTPFGTLWAPLGILLAAPSTGGFPCNSCAEWPLPIPGNPALVGAYVWAQAFNIALSPIPPGFCVEATEGAKIIIGA
ncbi:MAG TPA: hypothetical protein VFI25_07845 [Planctomycetota bacterium]|nr:hypothetical protein [Planctomycetota bacterium]